MLALAQNHKIEEETEEAHLKNNNHREIEHNANIIMQQKNYRPSGINSEMYATFG